VSFPPSLASVPLLTHLSHEWNLEELMERIWESTNMIRIYTKPKGQIPDYGSPVVLHATSPTIEDFCNRIHKQILTQFKYAWVWGSSVKHQPQKVSGAPSHLALPCLPCPSF
jgi:ribosome-interacting GTPase 1